MTTYGAYKAGLPCKNPDCKSHGKPHPNCRCYGDDMAEGGEVVPFCSKNRPHQKDCEYYAEGGPVPKWDDSTPVDEVPTWEGSKPLDEIPKWEDSVGEHGTLGQQILTGVEGLGQGVIGPVMTGIELGLSKLGVPGLSAEDIKGRQAENPIIHGVAETAGMAGSMLTGTGEALLIGKAAVKAAELAKIAEASTMAAKVGAGVLKGAIQGGLYQGSDEITKSMLGQGDPNESVASHLANGAENMLWGATTMGVMGGLGSAVTSGLTKLGEEKIGSKLHTYLSGMGETAKGADPSLSLARYSDPSVYDKGAKLWKNKMYAFGVGSTIPVGLHTQQLVTGEIEPEEFITKIGQDLMYSIGAGWAIKKMSPAVGSAIIKSISNGEMNPRSLFNIIDYADKVNSGAQKITRSVENIFKAGGQQTFNEMDLSKKRDKLNRAIENDDFGNSVNQSLYEQNDVGSPPQGLAKGGMVENKGGTPPSILQNNAVANNFPDQHVLMTAAKGRISKYLSGIRPQKNQPKLIFDAAPDNRIQQKSYNRALDIANQPLSVLDKIKSGTIDQEHIKHLNNMYPELTELLQKKLIAKVTDKQLKGEKPSYKLRQGLSMFMGAPLSAEFLPQNIMAAQATFQSQSAQPQPGGQPKKKTSALAKSNQHYMTANQAAAGRQQKQ